MSTKVKYKDYFATKARACGHLFVYNIDDTPQELKDFVKYVHMKIFNESLPNEWLYQIIDEAFHNLAIDALENCTIEADIYNYDLIEWLKNSYAPECCNGASRDGLSNHDDIINIISCGQYLAKETIYALVSEFLILHEKEEE